jgi:hypothetical protein
MPLIKPKNTASVPADLTSQSGSNRETNLDEIQVADNAIPEKFRGVINQYKLKRDGINDHYCFVSFRGTVQMIVKADGVSYLCREFVKSAHIIDIKTAYTSGIPIEVTVIMRVETLTGTSMDDVGSVPVKGNYSVALKHATTNARMRAFRAAVGFNVPDEVTCSEIQESDENNGIR